MSTHIRDAYTFATVVLLLVNTTFCLESISECFVSSFFSFRTFGFVCFFTQTAVQEQTYFLCLFFLVLAFSFMFCLTGWLSDLSESGAGLSGSAWIFLGWWRSPGAGVLSGGRCDNWWDLLLTDDFVREGTRERERPTSVFWHLQYISIFILKVLASRHNKKHRNLELPPYWENYYDRTVVKCVYENVFTFYQNLPFYQNILLGKCLLAQKNIFRTLFLNSSCWFSVSALYSFGSYRGRAALSDRLVFTISEDKMECTN